MVAVDTNVLLRLLLDDDEEQAGAARSLLRSHAPLFISHVVLAEAAWVLTGVYRMSREKLAEVFEAILETQGLAVQEPETVQAALSTHKSSRAGFADCLILAVARGAGASPLATFDGSLAKVAGTQRLGRKRARSPR